MLLLRQICAFYLFCRMLQITEYRYFFLLLKSRWMSNYLTIYMTNVQLFLISPERGSSWKRKQEDAGRRGGGGGDGQKRGERHCIQKKAATNNRLVSIFLWEIRVRQWCEAAPVVGLLRFWASIFKLRLLISGLLFFAQHTAKFWPEVFIS